MSAFQPHSILATSIPPSMVRQDGGRDVPEYQRLCIRSWIEAGFGVISVNDADEIPALSALYPKVMFIPALRNASAIGKKTPYIVDMLRALAATGADALGIVNADLVFEASPGWQRIPSLLAGRVIGLHRYDTHSLAGAPYRRYEGGFDCFFFDASAARLLSPMAEGFALGLPWWDCWMAAAAQAAGLQFALLGRPAALHLVHGQGYEDVAYRQLMLAFARFVARSQSLGLAHIRPPCEALAAYCDSPASPPREIEIAGELGASLAAWSRSLRARTLDLGGSTPVWD